MSSAEKRQAPLPIKRKRIENNESNEKPKKTVKTTKTKEVIDITNDTDILDRYKNIIDNKDKYIEELKKQYEDKITELAKENTNLVVSLSILSTKLVPSPQTRSVQPFNKPPPPYVNKLPPPQFQPPPLNISPYERSMILEYRRRQGGMSFSNYKE